MRFHEREMSAMADAEYCTRQALDAKPYMVDEDGREYCKIAVEDVKMLREHINEWHRLVGQLVSEIDNKVIVLTFREGAPQIETFSKAHTQRYFS